MAETEGVESADHAQKETEANKTYQDSRKRIRHRKKLIYEKIMKQMEFYFSDANLTKDRFLGSLVKDDPFVPLEMFLKFNKIKALTQDVTDIMKAMKHSTLLQLSEDKLKVSRKIELKPYDADSRTVYVESIPVSASQEWLEKVFTEYGNVAYISLPKFKNSHRIKGFGFIEFDKAEDAQKCVNTFTKNGCKLATSMPPEDLTSIKMFSVEEPSDDGEKDDSEPPKKKIKKCKDKKSQKHADSDATSDLNESQMTDSESKENLSQDECKSGDETPRKKKNKKKSNKSKKKNKHLNANEATKAALWGLQVLPKSEWKALRNKYLDLQRKYMKEMKRNFMLKKHSYSSIPAPAASPVEAETGTTATGHVNLNSIQHLEKIPGVFVKEVLPEPCLDVRLTKRTIRSNVHALHVDAKEGQIDIVIRFDSAKAASEYCSNTSNRAEVLVGLEEEEQWSRAAAARGKRPRGRDRLEAKRDAVKLAPASPRPTHTHLRFEDE